METQDQLSIQIQTSLRKAIAERKRLATHSSRLNIAGVILGALATFAAGIPSLINQPLIAGDWRLTCALAALITLTATIVTGLQNQIVKPDSLTHASECAGRLKALLIEMDSPDSNLSQVRKQYQAVVVDFSELAI